jgi:pimeloyl-ACP methyl ester carboxylesterase
MTKLLFLPGAGGAAAFWRPVSDGLLPGRDRRLLSWPGLGHETPRADVRGLDDLVATVLGELDEPADLIAQSMGGLVALKVALAAPDRVRRLVLTGTSGGLPMDRLGGAEWRRDYRAAFPKAAAWITETREDLSDRLGSITAPALLLWGDRDAISPPAVGARLQAALPHATLRIVDGGDHNFPQTHAARITPWIGAHLE